MLRNEKYMGDALLQKTYTIDFLSKKKVNNDGIAPQYYVENSHEAIIPKNIFLMAQEEMERRAQRKSSRRAYSSRYALSGIVFCEHCGETYRRVKWNNNGCRSTVWRCVSRVQKKTSGIDCPARTVREEDLHAAVVEAVNRVLGQDDDFFVAYQKSVEAALGLDNTGKIREIDEQLKEKQEKLIALSDNDSDYDAVADEIYALREEKQALLIDTAGNEADMLRARELMDFLKEQDGEIMRYDDGLTRRFIERITVRDSGFTVMLRSGIEVEIDN